MSSSATATVAVAAKLLGITPAGVRARIKKGTLVATKVNDQWVVTLPSDATATQESDATVPPPLRDTSPALVDALQAQIDYLQRENERKDSIILALASRIPQLPAPAAPESPQRRRWWPFR